MITEFNVKGFKKFDDFSLKNLGQINIILGKNNAGKTSLLEAIFTLACGMNFDPFFNVVVLKNRFNNDEPLNVYDFGERIHSTFKLNNLNYKANFSCVDNGEEFEFEHEVMPSKAMSFINTNIGISDGKLEQVISLADGQILRSTNVANWKITNKKTGELIENQIALPMFNQFTPQSHLYDANFLDVLAHRSKLTQMEIYSILKRNPILLNEFVSEMEKIFPEIKGLDVIPYPQGTSPVSIVKHNGDILPIYQFGDGMQRWFNVIGHLIIKKKSIKLFEELDATIHYEAQRGMGAYLTKLSKLYDNQIFATSHSIEFVRNFLEGVQEDCPENLKDVRIITLLEDDGILRSRNLDGEEALRYIDEFDLELR